MSEQPFEGWEAQVRAIARTFPYPPTPDIAGAVRQRLEPSPRPSPFKVTARLAVIALLLVAGLMAVPQVRAAVLDVLRIGAVRIFVGEPTATPVGSVPTPTLSARSSAPPATRPPAPSVSSPSVLDLAGETTLTAAEASVAFPIRLPTYPPDLGPPDRVFLQELGGPAVILVWLVPGSEREVRMSLDLLSSDVLASKFTPESVEEVTVGGRPALWVQGEHLLEFETGQGERSLRPARLVEGNVLIWTEGEITYRLESDLPLDEAVRVAESLE